MGVLRILNPFCAPVAPRHRTARAVEEIARQGRAPAPMIRRNGVLMTRAQAAHVDQIKAAKRAAQDSRPFWERG